MYLPPAFREDRIEVQHDLIRAYPLGLLITDGAGGLMANPVPFLIDSAASEKGTLRAHLARANPQLDDLGAGAACLVVFQGPQAYISPGWYATKQEGGRVVPTWNYVTVHVWGRPILHDRGAWLRGQLDDLTDAHERGQAHPWAVADAPADFIAGQMKGIVGIEIPIDRIEGKWKVSQNRPERDRAGVVAGLGGEADDLARLVASRGMP